MGALQDIISSVIIIFIVVTLVSVGTISFLKFQQNKLVTKVDEQRWKMIDTSLSSIFVATEPYTNQSFMFVLADYFFRRQGNLTVLNNETLDVEKSIAQMLDRAFGKGKYYIEVSPRITDVAMFFVMDASPTMDPVNDELGRILPGFIEKVKEKWGMVHKVYLLTEDPQRCRPYKNVGLDCKTLDYGDIYRNDLLYIEDYRLTFNISDLFVDYMGETTVGGSWYAESDWASAVASVSDDNSKGFRLGQLEMIVPITNEISLGSKAYDCYYINYTVWDSNSDSKPWPGLYKIEWCVQCSKVEQKDFDFSFKTVERIVPVLQQNFHVVSPINAFKCDYVETAETHDNIEKHIGSKGGSFCGDSRCPGCTSGGGGKGCFHPEANDWLNEEFEFIAKESGGIRTDLANINELVDVIGDIMNHTADNYNLKIGERKNATKLTFKKEYPVPQFEESLMDFYFEYYTEIPYEMPGNESALIASSLAPAGP